MEIIKEQVNQLERQVELLRLAVENLPSQVVAELSAQPQVAPARVGSAAIGYGADDEERQGFLLDEDITAERSARTAANQEMPPEAQIQRLTAQLTAAYNRIAALEEQLLSQRLH
jgi:hypothetical protein